MRSGRRTSRMRQDPGDIRKGDWVKVCGGNVMIGQTGQALQDARRAHKIDIQFEGYPRPIRLDTSRLVKIRAGLVAEEEGVPEPQSGFTVTAGAMGISVAVDPSLEPGTARLHSPNGTSTTIINIDTSNKKKALKAAKKTLKELLERLPMLKDRDEEEASIHTKAETMRQAFKDRRKKAFWG